MAELETKVTIIEKELGDQRKIHDRLDVAIEKLTDVSNSIHRMLAVHEEKIARQEEAIIGAEEQIEVRRVELSKKIDEVHSRVTETAKEHSKEILILRNDINNRVGVLEKWRHVLIGASIVIGFILHKVVNWS
jgi:chromosome segregation ATPase